MFLIEFVLFIGIYRFVLGEVGAAIHFLHDLGFSYGDLKPENVLITELGHIKVIKLCFKFRYWCVLFF